jgi:tRNA A-37 threonylcarbamoyl transferase component Bud32
VFVNYGGSLYVIKELPENIAQKEYELLSQMQDLNLPCVNPIGYATVIRNSSKSSILFTRYLQASVPYRYLFIGNAVDRYQSHLLDAISGLLVQLHSNGFYWGDCSLSNILFRRDAGALQAYLVDAETAEFHLPRLSPMLRYHDLEIMQENILGELTELQSDETLSISYPIQETGPYIQQRYRGLWEEITREDVFNQNELYRVQERVRALNSLGFSVKDIELKNEDHDNILKLRIFVSDRNFHRNQLMEISGLYAEDRQAQQIINEINELKANLSQSGNPNISLEAVAYYWMEHVYKPVIEQLKPLIHNASHPRFNTDPIELYCQILEHKWYLSERARHDVGHQTAIEDFIKQFS